MNKNILYLCFAVALGATAGSLILSEVLNWVPCVLCWYQRIMLFPLVIIFGAASFKKISNLEYIVWPLIILGIIIAGFHNLLQYNIIPTNLAPCLANISCVTPYHFWFEFLTIPLLSLLTFIIMAILMIAYQRSQHE